MSRYFWPNLTPSPLSHFVTHPGTPKKYVTHLGPPPPISSGPSTKNPDKIPLYKFSLNCSRGICSGVFCLEGFVRGGFCPFPLLSEYICYNRKLKITLHVNFVFHMYDKKFVTCSLPPLPVPNCHTFSDPLPLERDVLYGRTHRRIYTHSNLSETNAVFIKAEKRRKIQSNSMRTPSKCNPQLFLATFICFCVTSSCSGTWPGKDLRIKYRVGFPLNLIIFLIFVTKLYFYSSNEFIGGSARKTT